MGSHNTRSIRLQGSLSYLVATVLWGLNISLTEVLLDSWDPYFLSVLRVALATIAFVAVAALSTAKLPIGQIVKLPGLLSTSAFFAIFILLYNMGLHFSDPVTAAAVMAGTPVYAAITLAAVSQRALDPGFTVAATLTVLGSLIALSSRWDSAGETGHSVGALLILISYVFWNLFTLGTQQVFAKDSTQLQRTLLVFIGATFWLILGWLILRWVALAPPPNLNPSSRELALLIVCAVVITAGGALFWNLGVSRLGLAIGSLWQNMVPVFGVLIAALLGFIPTIGQIVGGLIVLSGVLWMQWRRRGT